MPPTAGGARKCANSVSFSVGLICIFVTLLARGVSRVGLIRFKERRDWAS